MDELRVLHVVNSLECGGAEHLVLETARAFTRRGWRPSICALTGNRISQETDGLCVRELGAGGVWDAAGLIRLARLMAHWRPHVVHTHLIWSDLWGAAALRLARGRAALLSTAHCTLDARSRSRLVRWLCRRAARARSWTVAISQAVADYRREQGEPRGRISVLPNAVEVDRFAAGDGMRARRALGIPADAPLIGCVARLDPIKGVDVLVEALARLRPRNRAPMLLVVGGGAQKAALRDLARRRGVGERVIFAGGRPRSEIPDLLAALDAFALPSRREGLGIALIEAMAAGRPVVASCVDGIPELVSHGETGLLAPPGDPGALAAALDLLLARPTFALSLGRAAHAEARRRFDLEAHATRLEALYRRLLLERPEPARERLPLKGMP